MFPLAQCSSFIVVLLAAGTKGFHIASPAAIYNWMLCVELISRFGDRLGRRFEHYSIISLLVPVVMLMQLMYSLISSDVQIRYFHIQFVLAIFVSVVWIALVLSQLAVGIVHNTMRREFIAHV
jgi:hypothetical protein